MRDVPPVGKPLSRDACRRRWSVSSLTEIRFLTVAEVAAVMRVSKMTVYRLVHSGELAAVRVGRSLPRARARGPRVPAHGFPEVG